MNDNKIRINISKSLNPNAFESGSRIQDASYAGVKKIIEDFSKKSEEAHGVFEKSESSRRKIFHEHNSIFVSGGRGSGKTTFLLGIEEMIKEYAANEPLKNVFFLDVIDPTLMHDSDNFLSVVIGAISGKVEELCCKSDKRNAYFESLSSVAEIISAIGSSNASIGLDRILDEQNALKLEKEIQKLLYRATQCLECKFFILPIDDIDMSFKRGFEVLERIRKYLATPFLLPVISGDFRLYEQVFANKFYSDLTNGIQPAIGDFEKESNWLNESRGDASGDVKKGFVARSFEMVNFYLDKVLPISKRINIIEIRDLDKSKILLDFGKNEEGKPRETLEIEKNIIDKFNIGTGKYCPKRINPVPSENLREYIQFWDKIRDFTPNSKGEKKKESGTEKVNAIEPDFYRKIGEFYKYGRNEDEIKIRDFAMANFRASRDGYFSVKKFAQDKTMLKYFKNQEFEKIVPFCAKEEFKYEKEQMLKNIDKLFFIISYEGTMKNGTRFYISPDKFFLWLSARLFSPKDFEDIDQEAVYSFGFDNVLFMNDLLPDTDILEEENESEVNANKIYEDIKYKNGIKNLALKIESLKEIKCSAVFLYSMYFYFRKNVNAILREIRNKETKAKSNKGKAKDVNDGKEFFPIFITRLIYAYVNALAISTIENKRFSENNICVNIGCNKPLNSSKIEDYLKSHDLAYRWNINPVVSDDKNKIITGLLDYLKRAFNIYNDWDFEECDAGNVSLSIDDKIVKTTSRPSSFKAKLTNSIKKLKEEKLGDYEMIEQINKFIGDNNLKDFNIDENWLEKKKKLLGEFVYNETFGKRLED